jgi:outer membrane receptor protein involved in Fe transport
MNKTFLQLVIVITHATCAWAQADKGTLAGTVFDAQTGSPLRGVRVAIDGHSSPAMATGLDGKFLIKVSPGEYKVSFSSDQYMDSALEAVAVKAGEIVDASSVLVRTSEVTTVEVTEKLTPAVRNVEAMLVERRLSAVVSDGTSSDEIRKTIASDAAGALEKVTGVSIVDNGYVFVRGLGERYSATMLNNAMIPTTEPERRVVPLDLFPASLIDNIRVLKTYSPDLPGEFSGGLVQMQTIEFPTAKTLNVSLSYGFNTQTTFERFRSYSGGSRDAFGFDDGTRALPSIIPSDPLLFVGNYTDQQFQEFGRSMPVNYEVAPVQSMRPSQTYSISGGNTYANGRIGIVGAFTFTNSPQRIPEVRRFLVTTGRGPQIFSDYSDFNTETEAARLGGVFNAAYKISPANKLIWRTTLTRDTDKEARVFTGLSGGTNQDLQSTRLRWVERSLISTGVEGDHAVSRLKNSVFHWQFTHSLSQRDEPDLRETIRGRESGTNQPFNYLNLPESGFRFFSGLDDKIYEPQADWSIPFYKGAIAGLFKAGFRSTIRRRDFSGRRFRYFPVRASTIDFTLPTNEVLGTNNIRPDGFVMREITRGTDTYNASMDIYGGYALVDLALGRKWRMIGGLRIEDAGIRVVTVNPLVPGSRPTTANLVNRDPLPAVNVIYQLTSKQNLRFGYARTVNRPDFRELSPFEFTNVVGGYSTVGNPNLLRAKITNYDARWEWFLGGNEILAASYFYKDFTDPIEQIYRPTASELRQSFLNVNGAQNQGVELEFRQNLRRYSMKLAPFAVQANFTFVDSSVVIPVDDFPQLTSRNRPLVGQSRYIINAIAEWAKPSWRSNARFYVNSVSRRLTDVGTFGLPDVYQERMVLLDAVYELSLTESRRWTLRFSAENLSNNEYRSTQADFLVRGFKIGRTFTVGTSFSIF